MNDLGEGEEAADLLAREKTEEKMRCFWREKVEYNNFLFSKLH
jgi:hypothetical protein